MLQCKNSVHETHYNILSVKEDASYEEIRNGYRLALLNHHPDKLQNKHQSTDSQNQLGDRFLKVQKAWEILGNSRSRAVYDSELRAYRKDTGVAEDVSLEDMMIEDGGEILELFYQCRCGDYFFVDSLELAEMGYTLIKDEKNVSFETKDELPAAVILPCGSCSLQVRLLINIGIEVSINHSM
ncbi:hypothetical protein JCGZ_22451 [Jatropha curcas]|uniref:J domain-containing protein n=1 Tax=Jatropha curcas TaxID=180498 RepID=A0A067K1V6_JATCU|nr:diphthamide biosynthesis protein 4 [Jatropha curcas]XP_012085954.1 diphthamide biosynthesis protein 4 [Jatropha curcas]KDP26205.1 hypothetical protein JCGZ_22451 [Jatropha curcas]